MKGKVRTARWGSNKCSVGEGAMQVEERTVAPPVGRLGCGLHAPHPAILLLYHKVISL